MTSIACNLNAFDAAQEVRYRALVATLRGTVRQVREQEDGFVFEFPSHTDTCLAAMEFATLERLCCSFLKFRLEIGPQGGPLTLTLTGPEGAKDILAEFAAPFLNGVGEQEI